MVAPRDAAGDPATSPFLQTAFEAAMDGFIVHETGRILQVNRATERLLKRSRDDLIGAQLTDYVPMSERNEMRARMRDRRSGTFKTHFIAGDGSQTHVMVNAVHQRIEGRDIRVLAIRPTAEAGEAGSLERDMELERLEQLNNFKTQLLNTAAHELNTPLTPLRLQVHLLRSQSLGNLSDRQHKAVSVLERNVERLAMLVSDILDVARLESGHLSVEAETTDLVDLVQEAAQSYEETARGVGVELTVETEGDLFVEADPRRVLQVLYNLVSNGIKFTPEGGRVAIRLHVEGDQAVVTVSDSGLGMTKQQLDALFEPFSRVHDTEKTAIPGTGLGLYISRGIVAQHGGTIAVESGGPNKGSTFRFTLPLTTSAAPKITTKAAPPSPMVTGPLAQRLRELI